MKWSTRIGTFAGIGVYVHATFLILIAWVAFAHWQVSHSVAAAVAGVAFVLALFACVVLHEFGHALTARQFGVRTRDITLLPIGGIARLERMPDDPRQELWVALAGPAVNVVIAALLFVVLSVTGRHPLDAVSMTSGAFLERLMVVNVFLALFNLLPAFPMDGGRVLRALLAIRMDYVRATQVAAGIGQGMALFFGLVGLFVNPFLIFIALFVWIGAGQEAAMTQMKVVLEGIPLSRVTITDFRTLAPEDSLARAVDLLLAGAQQDFPVVEEDGRVVGILTRTDLLAALARQEQGSPVASVMRKDFDVADAAEMIDVVLQRLQGRDCHTVPVLRRGVLVGLVTMDNVGEFVSVQAAVGRERERVRN